MSVTTALAVEELGSGYGPIRVLNDVSMTVSDGEVVSILGVNGAGKSTLMKTILGQVRATRGRISFRGDRIEHLSTESIVRRGLTLVPEGRHIFSRLSVKDNLRMGAYHRKDKAAAARQMQEFLDRFPILSERASQQAGTLSGGEQQQLAICRALMSNPSLILLDEPSLGLAPVMMDEVFRLVKDLRDRDGLTVLLVEQNVSKALSVSDRAYVLAEGQVVSSGTSAEIATAADEIESQYLGDSDV